MKTATRTTLHCALALALGLLATACNRDYDQRDDATTATSETAAPATAPAPAEPAASAAPATPTAQDAVAQVGAVDKHEVAAAEQARSKKVAGPVLEYADMLQREHAANLEAGQKLASTLGGMSSSPEVAAMEEKGRAELAALDAKSGKDYEKAYIDAMVKGHTEALALLDDRLIPGATDEAVRNFLTNSRDHVAMHLERARQLQSAPAP